VKYWIKNCITSGNKLARLDAQPRREKKSTHRRYLIVAGEARQKYFDIC
jgi:hypothetical protein